MFQLSGQTLERLKMCSLKSEDLQESVRQAQKPSERYGNKSLKSSLVRKLREGLFERNPHYYDISARHWLMRVNLNLSPDHPSLRLRVSPSLRLGFCQTLLLQHQRSSWLSTSTGKFSFAIWVGKRLGAKNWKSFNPLKVKLHKLPSTGDFRCGRMNRTKIANTYWYLVPLTDLASCYCKYTW